MGAIYSLKWNGDLFIIYFFLIEEARQWMAWASLSLYSRLDSSEMHCIPVNI